MSTAALIERLAASVTPQARSGPVPGRVLLTDGDAHAYVSGSKETAAGARKGLLEAVASAASAAGADKTIVLLTSLSSHKGHRYAVARAKPYQGKRKDGRRPANWEFIRQFLSSGFPGGNGVTCVETESAEADDLFHAYSRQLGWRNVVIHTQDKDMRMVPGLHLNWNTQEIVEVAPDTFELWSNDKLYGRKWFWLQMLHGDSADNVPGLPRATRPDGTKTLCGEVTAAKLLKDCKTCDECRFVVYGQYNALYQTEADQWAGAEAMLEQAVLLWMRADPDNVLDVCAPGHPMHGMPDNVQQRILSRINP